MQPTWAVPGLFNRGGLVERKRGNNSTYSRILKVK